MHVTVISARGRMTRCEINETHDGAAELRITSGSNTAILQVVRQIGRSGLRYTPSARPSQHRKGESISD